jgi:hypothetical protein
MRTHAAAAKTRARSVAPVGEDEFIDCLYRLSLAPEDIALRLRRATSLIAFGDLDFPLALAS